MAPPNFRPSAVFPLVLSAVSFSLILLLVLSGTRPDLVTDGFLISLNTTDVGKNLVQFSAAGVVNTTASPAIAARELDVHALLQGQPLSTSVVLYPRQSTTTTAPTLSIPSVAASAPPAAPGSTLNVATLGALFQIALNSFASGVGDTLKGIVTLVVTQGKEQLGVTQYYNVHLFNVCQGSVTNSALPSNSSNPNNVTRCISYNDVGTYIQNFTSTVSASTVISALNITTPVLREVPGIGKQTKSTIDLAVAVIFFFFIISLAGSALSFILSIAALFLSSYSIIHSVAALVTTISTLVLQQAAIASTLIAIALKSNINKFSSTLGLSATIGSKFIIFMWLGFLAAQLANSYWTTTWFVEYRQRSYKARQRTPQQMGDYKGIKQEIWSDIKLQKQHVEDDEERMLRVSSAEISWPKREAGYEKM